MDGWTLEEDGWDEVKELEAMMVGWLWYQIEAHYVSDELAIDHKNLLNILRILFFSWGYKKEYKTNKDDNNSKVPNDPKIQHIRLGKYPNITRSWDH